MNFFSISGNVVSEGEKKIPGKILYSNPGK